MMNTEWQPKVACSQPPMTGANDGAMENTIMMSAITRCASAPWKRSCTMVRDSTAPNPAAMPCRPRATSRTWMSLAKMASAEPAVNSSSDTITVGRRPKLSDSVPANSVVMAIAPT